MVSHLQLSFKCQQLVKGIARAQAGTTLLTPTLARQPSILAYYSVFVKGFLPEYSC